MIRASHLTQTSADADRSAARAAAIAFVEPLALPGMTLAVLYVVAVILGHARVPSQPFKFIEYGLLGITLAVALLGLANAGKLAADSRRWLTGVSACIAVIACVEYTLFASNAFCLTCAAVQFMFAVRHGWFRSAPGGARSIAGIVTFLVGLAAWTTAAQLQWWGDYVHLRSIVPYFIGIFAITMVLVQIVSFVDSAIPVSKTPGNERKASRLRLQVPLFVKAFAVRGFDAAVLAFIAMSSFRTAGLFHEKMAFHHWGVFIGPAEMIRQGGWLLWDVPSQYGFLSILILAALPFHSVWTELHVVVGACQTVSAFALYGCLTFCLRHPLRRVLAAAVSITTVFLIPCFGIVFGPQIMPSTTSFRFLWVYVILGALVLGYRARMRGVDGGIDIRPLVGGCIAWGLGLFWSYECAYWASAIWIPAYYLLLWQEWKRGMGRGPLLRLAALPAMVVSLGVALIEFVYRARLGHGPDWSCYGEYVRAFSNGFGQLTMNYQGSIWVVFICCLIPAVTAIAVFRKSPTDPAVPVLVGAAAAVFAVASYCIGRSHPNNVLNILPICFAAAALALRLGRRLGDSNLSLMTRTCLAPFFAVVISASIGIPVVMRDWMTSTLHPGPIAVDSRLPRFDPEAAALLAKAHIDDASPLAVYDLNPPRMISRTAADLNRPYWTPISPCGAITPLSPARAERYMARFVDRTHMNGWLLIPHHADFWGFDIPWVVPSLEKFYRPTKTLTSPNYTLIYFECKTQRGLS